MRWKMWQMIWIRSFRSDDDPGVWDSDVEEFDNPLNLLIDFMFLYSLFHLLLFSLPYHKFVFHWPQNKKIYVTSVEQARSLGKGNIKISFKQRYMYLSPIFYFKYKVKFMCSIYKLHVKPRQGLYSLDMWWVKIGAPT